MKPCCKAIPIFIYIKKIKINVTTQHTDIFPKTNEILEHLKVAGHYFILGICLCLLYDAHEMAF